MADSKPRYVASYNGEMHVERYLKNFEAYTAKQPLEDIRRWESNPEATHESVKQKGMLNARRLDGHFVKLGGGHTQELSEAMIVGWKQIKKWQRDGYDLIPVEIVIKEAP